MNTSGKTRLNKTLEGNLFRSTTFFTTSPVNLVTLYKIISAAFTDETMR